MKEFMNNLAYYNSLPYAKKIIEDENGVYTLFFPDLPGCITTGTSLEAVLANAEDAKENWLLACMEDGIEIPMPTDTTLS